MLKNYLKKKFSFIFERSYQTNPYICEIFSHHHYMMLVLEPLQLLSMFLLFDLCSLLKKNVRFFFIFYNSKNFGRRYLRWGANQVLKLGCLVFRT